MSMCERALASCRASRRKLVQLLVHAGSCLCKGLQQVLAHKILVQWLQGTNSGGRAQASFPGLAALRGVCGVCGCWCGCCPRCCNMHAWGVQGMHRQRPQARHTVACCYAVLCCAMLCCARL